MTHNPFSTYQCFDQFMQRAKKTTDYILPTEVCVMINVIFASKTRAARIGADAGEVLGLPLKRSDAMAYLLLRFPFSTNITQSWMKHWTQCCATWRRAFKIRFGGYFAFVVFLIVLPLLLQFLAVLEATLAKLSRYDEGNPLGTILSFAVRGFFSLFS